MQDKKTKKYESPKLKVFGTVRNLTGGSNGPHPGDGGNFKYL